MSNEPTNLTVSTSGHEVPSRLGVDGPSWPVAAVSLPRPKPASGHFRFVTEFNAFNGFIFSGKPGTTRPVPDAPLTHPGFPRRKSLQSRFVPARPALPVPELGVSSFGYLSFLPSPVPLRPGFPTSIDAIIFGRDIPISGV